MIQKLFMIILRQKAKNRLKFMAAFHIHTGAVPEIVKQKSKMTSV